MEKISVILTEAEILALLEYIKFGKTSGDRSYFDALIESVDRNLWGALALVDDYRRAAAEEREGNDASCADQVVRDMLDTDGAME